MSGEVQVYKYGASTPAFGGGNTPASTPGYGGQEGQVCEAYLAKRIILINLITVYKEYID